MVLIQRLIQIPLKREAVVKHLEEVRLCHLFQNQIHSLNQTLSIIQEITQILGKQEINLHSKIQTTQSHKINSNHLSLNLHSKIQDHIQAINLAKITILHLK